MFILTVTPSLIKCDKVMLIDCDKRYHGAAIFRRQGGEKTPNLVGGRGCMAGIL